MKDTSEIQKLNMVSFYLINLCRETNAETATFTQENVTHEGANIGSWEIVVRRIKSPSLAKDSME